MTNRVRMSRLTSLVLWCGCWPLLASSRYEASSCVAFVTPPTRYFTRQDIALHAEKKKKRELTLGELAEKIQRNPAAFVPAKPKKYKRTRKRVQTPKQQYLYAAQRTLLEHQGKLTKQDTNTTKPVSVTDDEFNPLYQARQMGLVNPAAQHCDPLIDTVEPEIVGHVRVGDEVGTSGSLAYIIHKPAGWAILGGAKKKGKARSEKTAGEQKEGPGGDSHETTEDRETSSLKRKKWSHSKRVKVKDEDGLVDILEYDEADILSVMTPEEVSEFRAEGGFDVTPEEVSEFRAAEGGFDAIPVDSVDNSKAENIRKIEARSQIGSEHASFAPATRPSVVAWLKERKAADGTPIRGGNYWTALTGATNVDDTGLVVICPKDGVMNVFVDSAKYAAVVGNGKYFAPKTKTKEPEISSDLSKIDVVAKLRKKRVDDTALIVRVNVAEALSTCGSLVQPIQSQFQDGIRGDPEANPLDRRASRRLIHCEALSVSSLIHDDHVDAETEALPDDIAIFAERRNHHEYVRGSFLGRASLKDNPLTTAYREINGAADGFEGWTVDRYDKWLLVQHDDKCYKGPLPSIHDGSTAGVYYLPANSNRSAMGSRQDIRPTLLEGRSAPDIVPVLENGITYHVSLDKDLSTGIFLDQRPQRAWLAKNCDEETRVLNCFAHCGAFSIAAATAGAATVSLDLNKKWLDRVETQLKANDIPFDDKHDCIYGDCFDWLARLAKRGELYDIVILDPPSSSISSVGKKKKRCSVKSDMADLVALAAPLVKQGGLLWTTTNSASIHPIKFARMCKKGLDQAGVSSAKLERVVPMPVDFPSIGPQPVKNLVWRL